CNVISSWEILHSVELTLLEISAFDWTTYRGGLPSQYTSHDFLALLQQYDIQVSMSGVGNCYDNAMMESFFSYSQNRMCD
ncbi:MAG: hypothetical protein CL607_23870, partial [Anaerolineaceae bacterium]|nr:hypothetical protein [Anaerolineaceae bacterium]